MGKAKQLRPTGYLLHKGTPPRLGDVATQSNTQKQTMEANKMRRQRNMFQMEEQNKTPEKEQNKMETSNLLGAEFKTLVIRMLNDLGEE